MAFWSTQTLATRLPQIVKPYEAARLKEASYRLSLGDQYYVTPHFNESDFRNRTRQTLVPDATLTIPAGQFAFLLTREEVQMPKDALGFISIQTDLKFRGLVNISGFHVDPGSRGKLIFSVFNAGPNTLHINYGEPIFRLWVSSLDESDDKAREGDGHNSIPTDLIHNISGSLESIQSLSAEHSSLRSAIQDLEHKLEIEMKALEGKVNLYDKLVNWSLAIMAGLAVATIFWTFIKPEN